MNKHLKPGVAVDVRGASDEDVHAVIDACLAVNLSMAKPDCGKGFIVISASGGYFWKCSSRCGLPAISINQALGRGSEVDCSAAKTVVQIVAHMFSGETKFAAYQQVDGNRCGHARAESFRPLKTEKEKFVERVHESFKYNAPSVYEKLYDIGLRFTE